MKVEQIYTLVNNATKEAIGTETITLNEDLSNLVEVGKAIENLDKIEKYVSALINRIGRTEFVDRVYSGEAMSVLREAWEFGSIKMKVNVKMPEATENESWSLVNGTTYSCELFTAPEANAKFFNKLTTFEVPMSFVTEQIKQSFVSSDEMARFIGTIRTAIRNTITVKTEAMIKRAIDNMIAVTVKRSYGATELYSKSTVKAVNLLYEYNQTVTTPLTIDEAIIDEDFIKFASATMAKYINRLKTASTLFNLDGEVRFTPENELHWLLHSDFKTNANVYLQSKTFHDEFTKLPSAEEITYWQGSGTSFAFEDTAKISVKNTDGDNVTIPCVIGCAFDTRAVAVCNSNERTTSAYNAKGEFYNEWHKVDNEYINAFDENFVVFFMAEAET